ncbi:hypothetical protein CSA08_02025 [Candidatus Gracilibacteria bacterium]|nr:MAG: hypothetical protein CSA08_02025 [Candidatus Gracilibacteria bacterium]
MALWQFDFNILLSKQIRCDSLMGDIEDIFGPIFDKSKSHIDFGSYETDRCTVYITGDFINDIECRLDLRTISAQKISELLKLVKKHDLKISVVEEEIVEENEFLERINTSTSMKFVKEGNAFFEKINHTEQ